MVSDERLKSNPKRVVPTHANLLIKIGDKYTSSFLSLSHLTTRNNLISYLRYTLELLEH